MKENRIPQFASVSKLGVKQDSVEAEERHKRLLAAVALGEATFELEKALALFGVAPEKARHRAGQYITKAMSEECPEIRLRIDP